MARRKLLPLRVLPPTILLSDCPTMVLQPIPRPRTNPLSLMPSRTYTSSHRRNDANQYEHSHQQLQSHRNVDQYDSRHDPPHPYEDCYQDDPHDDHNDYQCHPHVASDTHQCRRH
uniref:Uncharacterized protein n=1 Tax=Romanomermis culicivorax TaxID=13658 RepID=A0A915IRM8_ROMCU